MARAIDADAADGDERIYHIVCHDCPTEAITRGEAEATQQLSEHRSSTGHNVEYAALSDERVATE